MAISESQKGRAIEQFVGARLILQSNGMLRVSLPLVDDEGVDLVIGSRATDKTLLLQIKGRFSLSSRGHYRADVRRATCRPGPNKSLLFVYYDQAKAALGDTCWLVPAPTFCKLLENQKGARPVWIFDSTFGSKKDMGRQFRLPLKEVAAVLVKALQ